MRRDYVGAVLLVVSLGLVAVAVTDWPHGLFSAGLVAVALVVAKNL